MSHSISRCSDVSADDRRRDAFRTGDPRRSSGSDAPIRHSGAPSPPRGVDAPPGTPRSRLHRRVGAALLLTLPAACAPGVTLPRVLLTTAQGDIEIEVDTVHAPVTASNFLRYVDAGAYEGGAFFRTVRADNQPQDSIRIAVIQAAAGPDRPAFPAIPLEPTSETGLRHVAGTVSMARAGPHTATSSFFITIGDQPALDFGGMRNPDGQGFGAFGRVVRGMDVVRAIQVAPAQAQQLVEPVLITGARRISSSGR